MNESPEGESGTKGRHIVGNIDLTHNLSKERGIRITRALYNDDDLSLINERVDDMQAVLERQFIKADVVTKGFELDRWVATLQMTAAGMEALVAKRDAGAKLTSVDKAKMEKYDSDVRGCNNSINTLKGMIEAAHAKLKEMDEIAAAKSGRQ